MIVYVSSVCRKGETRFLRSGTALEICSGDKWFSLGDEVIVQTVTSAQTTTGLELVSTSTSVAFTFESSMNIGRYELSCSTTYGSTISQIITVNPPSNGVFNQSLFSLQPSQNYRCCVTLYFNTNLFEGMNHISQDCVDTATDSTSNTLVVCNSNSFSMEWLLYFLGGMMLLTLLILVVVVAAWITSCTRRAKLNSVSIHTRSVLKHYV